VPARQLGGDPDSSTEEQHEPTDCRITTERVGRDLKPGIDRRRRAVNGEGRLVAAPLDEPHPNRASRSYLGRKHDQVSFRGM
jgi:hypothetical protein